LPAAIQATISLLFMAIHDAPDMRMKEEWQSRKLSQAVCGHVMIVVAVREQQELRAAKPGDPGKG
jgi:hypothetical protein